MSARNNNNDTLRGAAAGVPDFVPRRRHLRPLQMVALYELIQALRDISPEGALYQGALGKITFRQQALSWFAEEGHHVCCEVLGIDPDVVDRLVRRVHRGEVKPPTLSSVNTSVRNNLCS